MPWWLLDYRVWLVAALAITGFYAATQKIEKEHIQAKYAQFRADTDRLASEAKVRNAQEAAQQALNAQEVISDLQTRNAALNARYRVLRDNPSSSPVPSLSTAAPSLEACTGKHDESDAATRFLAEVERRVIAITQAGDSEIAKYRELWELQVRNASSSVR